MILRLVVLLALSGALLGCSDSNMDECLLSKLPGTNNDTVAWAAYSWCEDEHQSEKAKQGSGRGLFGYNSGAECTVDKAADTASKKARSFIHYSCDRLYDEPNPFDDPNFGLD